MLTLTACGGKSTSAGAPSLPTSLGPNMGAEGGTRLQAKFLINSVGSARFVSMYDTELSTDCSFERTGVRDGLDEYHCVAARSARRRYRDAACSEPVAAVTGSPCATAAPGQLARFSSGCEPSWFELGAQLQLGQTFSVNGSGECERDAPQLAELHFEIATADFSPYVSGTLHRYAFAAEPLLELHVVEAEDGSRRTVEHGWQGEPCQFLQLDEHAFSCVGGLAVSVGGCSNEERLVLRPALDRSCGGESDYVLDVSRPDPAQCHVDIAVHRVGEKLPAAAASCLDLAGAVGPFALGPQVPRLALPELRLTADADPTVRASLLTALTGEPVEFAHFDLVTSSEPRQCSAHLMQDGSHRCVDMTPPTSSDYFADPSCGQPLHGASQDTCNRGPPHYAVEYSDTDARCERTVSTIREYVPYDGPVYERDATQSCVASDSDQLGLIVPGNAVPPETFPALELVRR